MLNNISIVSSSRFRYLRETSWSTVGAVVNFYHQQVLLPVAYVQADFIGLVSVYRTKDRLARIGSARHAKEMYARVTTARHQ